MDDARRHAVVPRSPVTTSSTSPSLMRMRWPSCTSLGSGVNGVETDRALPTSGSVVIDEQRAGLQVNDAFDVADPELRPLDVADDRHVLARWSSTHRRTMLDESASCLLVRAVREVETEDVDARRQQPVDDLFARCRRGRGWR